MTPRSEDPSSSHGAKVVFDHADLSRTLVRIAHEIVEKNGDRAFALVGVHRRGVPVARRLAAQIADFDGRSVPVGELDISFYRDDIGKRSPSEAPVVHSSSLDFSVDFVRFHMGTLPGSG